LMTLSQLSATKRVPPASTYKYLSPPECSPLRGCKSLQSERRRRTTSSSRRRAVVAARSEERGGARIERDARRRRARSRARGRPTPSCSCRGRCSYTCGGVVLRQWWCCRARSETMRRPGAEAHRLSRRIHSSRCFILLFLPSALPLLSLVCCVGSPVSLRPVVFWQ
jgi:hypothetical protein